ncbi:glycosyltransferase family 61 protein [Kamptonema animale CS-326]|jgi:capsular polysaccharide biosynthesis protein|uniref:glycosyltransferase family 61 protein n=1 Tax=Kamptonema animale TaxID=92934 RepID=UPI00232D32BD|nr:glycosyltransferase family 61 protein [Kamptonema animale]MDB9511537.1 glycosyltransferase family 61 protein [Kamptonema animale CS-326]
MPNSLTSNFQKSYLRDLAAKIYNKLKYLIKVYILLKPYARGVIQLSIDNADRYFGKDRDIKIHKLVSHEDIPIQPAKFLEGDFLEIITPFKNEVESVMIDARKEGFSFANNHIITPKLKVIYEKDIEFEQLPIYREELPVNYQKLAGTIAYLSNTMPQNYGHWFFYTLPMLEIYWKYIDKQEIDYYYIGDSLANFQRETLVALGIKEEQVVTFPCKPDRAITCVIDRKIQNNGHKYPTIFGYRFARSLFVPEENYSSSKYPKRLYIKRGKVDHREVINDNEVVEYLESIGFESLTMQGRTIQEQAEIYYNADAIISVCGSALTNLMFIRENITVIEIFPFGYLDGFFYALASYAQANYFYIIGEEIPNNPTAPHFSNLTVNINKLKQICKLADLV